ncbi:MAG: hypothetical protein M3Y08_16105 [Fibrobacterota bacterium]|nr:hypothetical protein [Fibrobacterota bacterium]
MIKQYVNLPNNAANHYGKTLNLVVEANQLADENTAYTEWWVEATGADNVDTKYLSASARAHMRYNTRHHSGTRFRNTLLLPHVGGEKYQVKCSKRGDRSSPVEMEEIETWRKIFYTLHWMNNACNDTFNAVKDRFKSAFEEAFVELEEKAAMQTLLDETNTRATDVLPHLYNSHPVLADRPWHLRIVVLNDIYDLVEQRHAATGVPDIMRQVEVGRPLADRTADDWLVSARAKKEPHGSWVNIRALCTKDDDTHFTFDMSANVSFQAHFDNGGTFNIQIRTRERNHYLGHSIGNFVCVRINEDGTPAAIEQTILQTFTHEVGHGFQQVIRRERIHNAAGHFTSWETNLDWHTNDHGGQGPHCRHDAEEVVSATTTSGMTFASNGSTLCTMFFSDNDDVDVDGKFCAACLPRLRRANLGRAKMIGQDWNDY